MKIRKKNKSFERSMAASQILILLVGIVAFSYGVGFVSGNPRIVNITNKGVIIRIEGVECRLFR